MKLEGAEYEAKRRKELEQAMRKAVGLDMDDPSLDEEVHPAIFALLRKLKERGGGGNIERPEVLLGAFFFQRTKDLECSLQLTMPTVASSSSELGAN